MSFKNPCFPGILLTKAGCEDKEIIDVVDCVPLFHYNIPLSPMFIVALTQVFFKPFSHSQCFLILCDRLRGVIH